MTSLPSSTSLRALASWENEFVNSLLSSELMLSFFDSFSLPLILETISFGW